jgi:NADPH:quinone reductase-like Zn-dependent oxidoreductase
MSSTIPSSMLALALAQYGSPKDYNVATIPTPTISKPDEILIKVHAASINPIDVKMATGIAKMMVTET